MATGPAYMNSITSHSKVKTHITLSAPLFVAGQDITGKMELECKAERELGIGVIIIELLAVQELNSRDHTAATTFVHCHRVFQGPGLPPSNAVYDHTSPQDPTFPPDYFPGRKGVTTFFFKFPTPVSSPSSVSFASDLAKIEYKIRVNIGVAYKGDTRLLTNSISAELVQCQDMEGTADEHVAVGEGGKMYARGKLIGGKVVPGEKACLELHVRNQTTKKTAGLTLTLMRSLHLHGAGASVPVQLTDTLLSESFRSAEYCVSPNTEGVANLVFTVPGSTRVVKGGIREDNVDKHGNRKQIEPLFELRCYLSVKIGMGLGSKDVLLAMPIQVQHRAALGQGITHDHRNAYLSPTSPEPIFHRTMSPLLPHSPRALSPISNPHSTSVSPVPYTNQSPIPVYTPYQQSSPKLNAHPRVLNPGDPFNARAVSPPLWSPASLGLITSLPSQSPLSEPYYFPPPPPQLLPFTFPARPNSAGPYYYPYYYQNETNLPNGLPPVSAFNPFSHSYSPFHLPLQPQNQPPLPPIPTLHSNPTTQPQAPPPTELQTASQPEIPSASSQLQDPVEILEADDQPVEGKGERASRIAHHLHFSNRARSTSPTSHRFQAPSVSTINRPPPSVPQRPYATSSRHLPVLSPRPVVSPSRTYVGHSSGTVERSTTKSDRVDLLEQMVDLAPGDEEKSVEDVLREIDEAERASQDKKGGPVMDSESFELPVSSGSAHPRKKLPLLDVFNRELDGRKDHNLIGQCNEGLDALERRLLQEVGTRKPEAARPTVFDLRLADKSTATITNPPEHPIEMQDKIGSRPSSPHTVRLHPRQFRESQISELSLGLDNCNDNSPTDERPPSPAAQKIGQKKESVKQTEPKQPQKAADSRDDAKGRVSAWLSGLPSPSPAASHAVLAPATHLAEPKKAPPRKRSIDGVLEFFGIRQNKSTEDIRVVSLALPPSPVLRQQPDISKEESGLTVPSQSSSASPALLQRRTPPPTSPRRKPAPPYDLPSQPQINADRLPNDSLDTRAFPRLPLETGQENGAPIRTGEIPSFRPQAKPASRPKGFQTDFKAKETHLPIGRIKPTPKPAFTPKVTPLNCIVESSTPTSANSKPRSALAKLQTKEKVNDTLPPIPASARQKLALPISNSEAKYDVRSARGGRGGITTSVAAIWASRANDKEASLTHNLSVQSSPVHHSNGGEEADNSTSPTSVAQVVPPESSRSGSVNSSDTPSQDPIKATSVPAQIHRYHAKPQLSSAATLSQPVLDAKYKPPALSMNLGTILETSSIPESSSTKPGEIPFGQARLKDLIKKYQQGAL